MYGRIGENNPMFGKNDSAETKALISIVRTGINSSVSKKVFIYYSATMTIISHKFVSIQKQSNIFVIAE